MHGSSWWIVLMALFANTASQTFSPTICEETSCRCDAFTRVICNCPSDQELTLRPDGAYSVPQFTTGIIIEGCLRVTFLPETIRNLKSLRNVEIRNVNHVDIRERSLSWLPASRETDENGIRILIDNSTISEIASHAIQGSVENIVISRSSIDAIRPYAFSSLYNMKQIQLLDNVFHNVEIHAFKKFTMSQFLIKGAKFNVLQSRFLSNVDVTDLFHVEGAYINILNSLAFIVNSPKKVLIENNYINVLEGDGFHIMTNGPVTFRNNTIKTLRKGALFGFTLDAIMLSNYGPQELLIDNNTMSELSPSSLTVNKTAMRLRIDGLNINVTCSCELSAEWQNWLKEQGGTISCWYSLEDHYISLPTYIDKRCGAFKQKFWIFILIGILAVVLVAIAAVYFIVKRENEKKKRVQIVMPDGKTYQETEFHIVVERAELLTTDL